MTEALQRLSEAATPGPWTLDPDDWVPPQEDGRRLGYRRIVAGRPNPISGIRKPVLHTANLTAPGSEQWDQDAVDAELATLAVNYVRTILAAAPAPAAEVEQLRAENLRLRTRLAVAERVATRLADRDACSRAWAERLEREHEGRGGFEGVHVMVAAEAP